MKSDSRSNKNSASEDEVGKIHNFVSSLYNLKGSIMLAEALRLKDQGADPLEILDLINSKDVKAMADFVEKSNVGCLLPENDDTSEISKQLKKLEEEQKGKLVNFKDIMEAEV